MQLDPAMLQQMQQGGVRRIPSQKSLCHVISTKPGIIIVARVLLKDYTYSHYVTCTINLVYVPLQFRTVVHFDVSEGFRSFPRALTEQIYPFLRSSLLMRL